jgi:hypothetical protein
MPEPLPPVTEARLLATALLAVVRELCDDYGDLSRIDPELEWENLPFWLTREAGAPETWQRGGGR